MKKFTLCLVFVFLAFSLVLGNDDYEVSQLEAQKASVAAERSPNPPQFIAPNPTEALGDTLYSFNGSVLTPTPDIALLGVEFAENSIWMTGRDSNSSPEVHKLYQVNADGTALLNYWPQGTSSTWGWRDMAFDGTYLYASDSPMLEQIDPATGQPTGVTIPGPEDPNRALAYDPATDHFWTANFGSDIYEFDRNGNIINQYTNSLSVYGAAWDKWSPGGPYLWLWSQDGPTGGPACTATQIDPATGNPTGVSFVGTEMNGDPTADDIAGGATISDQYDPSTLTFIGLHQSNMVAGDGYDFIVVYDMDVPLGDPLDPLPPTNFTAYSDYTTPNGMELNWTDPTNYINGDPLTNFQIIIARDGAVIDSVGMGVQTYTDAGLSDGTLYTYDIWAKDVNDSTSSAVSAEWIAGGAGQPEPPTSFHVGDPGTGQLRAYWTNPTDNIDGTPMDDLAEINLYEDGSLLTTFTVSLGDTGAADSADFTASAGTHQYYVTAVDNESPPNESDPSNMGFSPLAVPFFDDFPVSGVPDPGFWLNTDGEVTDQSVNPPSPPYALTLDGHPNGGDNVALLPVDLTGYAGQGLIISYWYQPQGTGNAPESGDSLIVEALNDLGQWKILTSYPGTNVVPFVNEIISLDNANPGTGATFFHPNFQFRFRNYGTSSSTSHFDLWLIDDVSLGLPVNNPLIAVTPTTLADTLLVGDSLFTTLTISNTQSLPSVLNFDVTEIPAVDWFSVSPDSGTVTSSNSMDLTVLFDASVVTAGTYNTQLEITSNDTTNPLVTVDVTLVANEAPNIVISPDTVQFDTLFTNEQDSTTFTISNTGNGPLEILGIEDEEVTTADWTPSFIQPQRHAPNLPKGAPEPSYPAAAGQPDGAGGPDPFGYKWIDSDEPGGPAYQFTDISGTGTILPLQPTGTFDPYDEGMGTINLPWDVKFYGQNFNQLQVNTNGVVIFDMNYFANTYTNDPIPDTDDPNGIIAPFWDDLDGRAGGEIYHQQMGNQYIIQWHNWGHYPQGTENMIFQVILMQNSSTIYLVYEHIVDEASSTYGIENMDGTVGLEIAYNVMYAHDQLLVKISKGAEWLTQEPTTGTIPAGGSMDIKLKADATGLLGGTYRADVVVSSNDPDDAVVKKPRVILPVKGVPDIATTPDPMDFDSVFVGATPTEELMVKNTGSDTLFITNVTSDNPLFTVDTTTFQLAPYSSLPVNVTFEPLTPGFEEAWIVVESNDPDTPLDTTHAMATAVEAPVISVDPTSLNQALQVGDSIDVPVHIGNIGGSPLTWDASVISTTMLEARQREPFQAPPNYPRGTAPVSVNRAPETSIGQPAAPSQIEMFTEGLAYGVDALADAFIKFYLTSPMNTTNIGTTTGDLYAGDFDDTGIFYAVDNAASNLVTIDSASGTITPIGPMTVQSGHIWTGLTYDVTTGTMYAASTDGTISTLYTVDMATGATTVVGSTTTAAIIIDIAVDNNGVMYAHNINPDAMYLIDKNTAAATQIGPTGFDANFAQGMDVDPATNELYLAAYNNTTSSAELRLVDVTTGGTVVIGPIGAGSGVEVCAFGISGEGVPPWILLLPPTSGTIQPGDIHDLMVRFYGIQENSLPDTFNAQIEIGSNDPVAHFSYVDVQLIVGPVGIQVRDQIPTTWAVEQNYPNPFNPSTSIKFQVPKASDITLTIYNVLGQKVRTLVDKRMEPGYYNLKWNGRNDTGAQVASGIYIYRFESKDFSKVKKMILMK